ncbi:phage holin [Gordonia sp. MMO-8]|uniref:phage holin n=1 Tax=Gordonia sp. MMO-8 TaxID=3127886 RepID=UPI0030183D6C
MNRMTPEVRRWLYGVALAVVAIAVAYGIITQDQAALWVTLVAAILSGGGNALARANTPGGRYRSE